MCSVKWRLFADINIKYKRGNISSKDFAEGALKFIDKYINSENYLVIANYISKYKDEEFYYPLYLAIIEKRFY